MFVVYTNLCTLNYYHKLKNKVKNKDPNTELEYYQFQNLNRCLVSQCKGKNELICTFLEYFFFETCAEQ